MKKFLCLFMTFLVLASVFPVSVLAADSMFDVSQAVIVTAEAAAATDNYAAQRLKYYLEDIIGKEISVVSDAQSVSRYEISVGDTNREETDLRNFADGGYVITSSADKVVLCGAGNKGTINAVYAFLEKYCGCKWYESEVIVIPDNPELKIEAGINVEYHPFFEYTEADTESARDTEFSIANGLNGGIYRTLTAEQGSTVGYVGLFAHTLVMQYCRPEVYFEEHPEYYALHNGKRVAKQLCLTNSDVIDIVTQEVLDMLKKEHNPDASIQIVSLTQHDNKEYCKCKNCAALDKKNGSQSGTMITFVNTVAQRVKAAGNYENVVFDTFAYQYTRKAPTNVVPRDDVIVRLCSIECCFGHTLDDPGCKNNVSFMNDLAQWRKICNRIYIWDYVNNYRESICVFPNFGVLQRNIQIFYENNVKGLYEEGNYYVSQADGKFDEMKTYLLSKLMQNPYIDYYEEMDGYLEAVYGSGWESIREFIDIATEHAVTKTKHLGMSHGSTKILYNMKKADIEYCNKLWEKAKAGAQTQEQLSQVLRSELCWRYWKCANKKSEFSRLQFPYLWMSENDRLYNDLVSMGIVRIGEGGTYFLSECESLHLLRHPFKWTVLYEDKFFEFINPMVLKIYEFLGEVYNYFNKI